MAGALAGTLLIDIATNTAKLVQGFDDAEKKVAGFASTLKKIGGAIGGVFSVQQVHAFGEAIQASVDAMGDMAENLKIPVEDFQALQNAALLAGQSMETTGAAIGKFNVFIGKAGEGSKEQIERLNELGVKILDVNGKIRPTTDLLQEVAIAITKISDPTRRAAAEVEIFGKSGQSISAILNQWTKSTTDLNRELAALGLVHSPETIKAFDEMSKQADITSKKIEVLFGYFYAIGKSTVLDVVAKGIQGIANAINSVKLGSAENMIKVISALALMGTVVGAPAGFALLTTGIDDAATVLNKQITATSKSIEQLEKDLEAYKSGGAKFAEQTMQTAGQIAQLQLHRADLIAKQKALDPLAVTVSEKPTGGTGQPGIKATGGVDKYAEAMRKLREETESTEKAIAEFNKLTEAGETGKEAARQAKLIMDIGTARSKVLTDIPKGVDPKPLQEMAENLVKLKFRLDELKESQKVADGVHKDFGDGTRELKDRMDELNKAYAEGRIKVDEYNFAVKTAKEQQQTQKDKLSEEAGGLEGLTAGWDAAARAAEKSMSTFNVGQNLFTGSMNIMSESITSFMETGVFSFQKLATSFAKMLAEMAIKLALYQGLKTIFGVAGGGVTPGSGTLFSLPAPEAPASGMMAGGGSVLPNRSYLVGERGPEAFVPNTAGAVVPAGGSTDVTVNVDMGTTQGARDPSKALDFGRKLQVAIKDVILNEKRPGGALYSRVTA